jgi:hypothetical protein
MNQPFITVRLTKVYGNETVYPVCDKAKLFAGLAGTSTLTPHAIRQIKALGYEIWIEQQKATL